MWRISNLSACQMLKIHSTTSKLTSPSPFYFRECHYEERASERIISIYCSTETVVDFFCCCWSRDMKIFIIKNSRAHRGIFSYDIFHFYYLCGSSERISTQLMNFSSHLWTLFSLSHSLHNHRHLWVNATWLMKIFRD